MLNDIELTYENKSLRELSNLILNKASDNSLIFLGGSADLSSSCKTNLKDLGVFSKDNYLGRNLYFGIREHAMGGILNGMALSGLRVFGSTFLTFSDYMRPSIRMSAMMNLGVLYIFTHDSITVSEDGPTHQAIEQTFSLNLIPNLKVYRPYDYNELIGCYKEIFENNKPSCLLLSRSLNEISEFTKASLIEKGIYEVITTNEDNYINLISSGEELGITLKLANNLKELGIYSKVFSVPCLKNVNKNNIKSLLNNKLTIGITLTNPEYFYLFTNNVFGVNNFLGSGSKEELLDYIGFNLKKLEEQILDLLNK